MPAMHRWVTTHRQMSDTKDRCHRHHRDSHYPVCPPDPTGKLADHHHMWKDRHEDMESRRH